MTLCLLPSDSRQPPALYAWGKVPQRTNEKDLNWWPITFLYLLNSLFCSCLRWSEGVRAFLSVVLKYCSQWWNKVLCLWDSWPPFLFCHCTEQIYRKIAPVGLRLISLDGFLNGSVALANPSIRYLSIYQFSAPVGKMLTALNCLVFRWDGEW